MAGLNNRYLFFEQVLRKRLGYSMSRCLGTGRGRFAGDLKAGKSHPEVLPTKTHPRQRLFEKPLSLRKKSEPTSPHTCEKSKVATVFYGSQARVAGDSDVVGCSVLDLFQKFGFAEILNGP